MTWYYGKCPTDITQYGFYTSNADCLDGVEVSDSDYATLMEGCTCSKRIVPNPNNNNYPMLSNTGYDEDVSSKATPITNQSEWASALSTAKPGDIIVSDRMTQTSDGNYIEQMSFIIGNVASNVLYGVGSLMRTDFGGTSNYNICTPVNIQVDGTVNIVIYQAVTGGNPFNTMVFPDTFENTYIISY